MLLAEVVLLAVEHNNWIPILDSHLVGPTAEGVAMHMAVYARKIFARAP